MKFKPFTTYKKLRALGISVTQSVRITLRMYEHRNTDINKTIK